MKECEAFDDCHHSGSYLLSWDDEVGEYDICPCHYDELNPAYYEPGIGELICKLGTLIEEGVPDMDKPTAWFIANVVAKSGLIND